VSLQYLLDEHIPRILKTAIIRREPTLTVWKVGDAGAPGLSTLDPEILNWCEHNDFVLVTNNRRSMPRHLADHLALGRHVPGILTINIDLSIPAIAEELVLIAMASLENEHRDLIRYLPLA
jgi:hypothetical protein